MKPDWQSDKVKEKNGTVHQWSVYGLDSNDPVVVHERSGPAQMYTPSQSMGQIREQTGIQPQDCTYYERDQDQKLSKIDFKQHHLNSESPDGGAAREPQRVPARESDLARDLDRIEDQRLSEQNLPSISDQERQDAMKQNSPKY